MKRRGKQEIKRIDFYSPALVRRLLTNGYNCHIHFNKAPTRHLISAAVFSRSDRHAVDSGNQIMFVATFFSRDKTFVATNIFRDKQVFLATISSSRQAYICRDKNVFCRDKHVFVATKVSLLLKLCFWRQIHVATVRL